MEESLAQARELMKKGFDPSLFTTTLEKPMRTSTAGVRLRIGVPREIGKFEARVSLTPGAAQSLVASGHEVVVETNAGERAGFSDLAYVSIGASIAESAGEVFARTEIIVKVAPLEMSEVNLLQPRQTVISAVHLGSIRAAYLQALLQKNITALGFEFLQDAAGGIPLMRLMSEIAGISSIHIASSLLASQGQAMLLGGITGVPPTVVTIIGAGTVGLYAAKTALGLGAVVRVIDEEIGKLERLEARLGCKVHTAISQQDYVRQAVSDANVVIGAAYKPGHRAPVVVTEDMVLEMREGTVLVDVSIDQGGCFETSRVTSHDSPTYIYQGVTHYCVPNIAAGVANTASHAISNILGPMLLRIGEAGGIKAMMASSRTFKKGIYVYHKHITQRVLASMFNIDFMDIDLLYAAQM
jgi:alanine dehydrogenase